MLFKHYIFLVGFLIVSFLPVCLDGADKKDLKSFMFKLNDNSYEVRKKAIEAILGMNLDTNAANIVEGNSIYTLPAYLIHFCVSYFSPNDYGMGSIAMGDLLKKLDIDISKLNINTANIVEGDDKYTLPAYLIDQLGKVGYDMRTAGYIEKLLKKLDISKLNINAANIVKGDDKYTLPAYLIKESMFLENDIIEKLLNKLDISKLDINAANIVEGNIRYTFPAYLIDKIRFLKNKNTIKYTGELLNRLDISKLDINAASIVMSHLNRTLTLLGYLVDCLRPNRWKNENTIKYPKELLNKLMPQLMTELVFDLTTLSMSLS